MNYSHRSVEYVIHFVPPSREDLDDGIRDKNKNDGNDAVENEPIQPKGNRENNVWNTINKMNLSCDKILI